MRRQSDTAAHDKAVHEGDIGFRELLDPDVEDVFLAPQYFSEIALNFRAFPERADVAAGAEAAFARALQYDDGDGGIGLEGTNEIMRVIVARSLVGR